MIYGFYRSFVAGGSRPGGKKEKKKKKKNGGQSFEPYPNALRKSIIPFRGAAPPLTLICLQYVSDVFATS